MTKDQRKRQQEVLASAVNYLDDAWDIILARLQENPELSSTIFRVDFTDDDFAASMVALVNSRRKELAEQRAQERRDRPMTPARIKALMYTLLVGLCLKFKNSLLNSYKKSLIRFKELLHSQGKVDAPSHSQNIPEAQVEVPSQEATLDDVEVPSNIASKAQQTASSLKKVEGDPDAEHKLCIKYAFVEDSASDCDTPVHLYVVVDWELFPTRLGSINAIYRLDNSRKYFTSLREILHLVTRADLMMIYSRVMTFYQDKKDEGVVSGLVVHMCVDKKYTLSLVNLSKDQCSDHKAGKFGHGTAIRLESIEVIGFIFPEVEMVCNQHVRSNLLGQGFSSPTSNVLHGSNPFWVPMVTSPRVNGYCFKVLLFNPSGASKTVLSRNLKFNVSDSSLGRGLLGFL
ncbi:hypothetical protein Tco_0688595 [Tanacetum coccineum]